MEGQYLITGNYRYGHTCADMAVHFFSVSANTAWDGKCFSSSVLPAQATPPNNYANLTVLNT